MDIIEMIAIFMGGLTIGAIAGAASYAGLVMKRPYYEDNDYYEE